MIGRHFTRIGLLRGVSLQTAVKEFSLIVSGKKRLPFELTLMRKNKTEVIVEANPHLVRDGKKVLLIQVVFRDMTQRRKAQEELWKLSRAIEQSPASIIITNLKGEIEYVNPKFCRVTGYGEREVIGKNPRILKSGETPAQEYQKLWEAITAGKEWRGEFHNRRKNGELFWEAASISAIRNSDGNITHYLAIKEDISDQKQMEKELMLAYQELETSERSLKVMYQDLKKTHEELKKTEHQLLQSEKMAAIGQLAAGIAHEINNPVGFISSNLTVLTEYIARFSHVLAMAQQTKTAARKGDMDQVIGLIDDMERVEEQKNFQFIQGDIKNLLEESKNGIERIKKIVLDLKTFARQDKKESQNYIQVEKLLDSVINIVWNEIKYKAKLEKKYDKTPLICCDPQRMGQVFINLLINAAHAISGTGTITLRTYAKDKMVYIQISDSGCGIPKENLTKIFDPFFTTKSKEKGTGLGLSISYSIIHKHGGDIKVESEEGKGTTFTISLPAE